MGRACSKHGGRGMHIGFGRESKKERDHCQDLDVGGKIYQIYLREIRFVVWTGFMWLRIVTAMYSWVS
jgi:hypothetical protein